MAIPISTTTISVLRRSVDPNRDPADAQPDEVATSTGIAAHISSPSGVESEAGGTQTLMAFRLSADPCDLQHTDRVLDEVTGQIYEVLWSAVFDALELEHVEAGLRQVLGTA